MTRMKQNKMAVKKTKVKAKAKPAKKKKAVKKSAEKCSSGCGCSGGCKGPSVVYHGMYVSYDPETSLYVEANYDMGVLHGEYTEFYDIDSGLIKRKGNFVSGLKEGQWICYAKDGSAEKVEIYKKGKKTSV